MINKNNFVTVIVSLFVGFSLSMFLGGDSSVSISPNNKTKIENDYEYYKYVSGYKYLLNTEEEKRFDELIENIDDDELVKKLAISYMDVLFKESGEVKEIIDGVINEVKENKKDIDYFDKNTSCVSLESSIKDSISSDDSLEFIFYSPSYDSCLYVVSNSYKKNPSDIYSYSYIYEKDIYKAGSSQPIKTFRVYGSDDYDDEFENNKSKKGVKEFVNFVLENSNYNMELLEDSDYIYIEI